MLNLDGVFVLKPRAPAVPELAAEIERLRVEAGLSTDDLSASLRAERERYDAFGGESLAGSESMSARCATGPTASRLPVRSTGCESGGRRMVPVGK